MKVLKIFDGFITNSSSINFLIATKEDLTKELLQNHLKRYPKTKSKSSFFAKELWQSIALDQIITISTKQKIKINDFHEK